jgi:hypothetical protein
MARDEREEEREFLDRLQARTGRSLAEWMAAIGAQGFADKNDTIDWLRRQGLTFARASWLERIHANGGNPIYSGAQAKIPAPPTPPAAPPPPAAPGPAAAPPAAAPPPRPPAPEAPEAAASLAKLVAAAKGYQPLYHLLEAEIRRCIPTVVLTPQRTYISVGAPAEFAAITLHATGVRLGLALGDHPIDPQLQKARMQGPGPGITHMVVLTDARQVNADLLARVRTAAGRVGNRV